MGTDGAGGGGASDAARPDDGGAVDAARTDDEPTDARTDAGGDAGPTDVDAADATAPTLVVHPASFAMAPGDSAIVQVELVGGDSPVTVTMTGLPAGVTASPASLALAPSSRDAFVVTASLGAPLGVVEAVVVGGGLQATVALDVAKRSGALDVGFGDAGIAVVPETGPLGALALDANGELLAGGENVLATEPYVRSEYEVARFTTDGALDATFGTGGLVAASAPGGGQDDDWPPSVSFGFASTGAIYVGGTVGVNKLSATGVLDATFTQNSASTPARSRCSRTTRSSTSGTTTATTDATRASTSATSSRRGRTTRRTARAPSTTRSSSRRTNSASRTGSSPPRTAPRRSPSTTTPRPASARSRPARAARTSRRRTSSRRRSRNTERAPTSTP